MHNFDLIIDNFKHKRSQYKDLGSIFHLKPLSAQQIKKIPDDRFLAMMTKAINQSGFSRTVVEKKWLGFEEAFFGFDLHKLSVLTLEEWDHYIKDKRIIRHGIKVRSVRDNMLFILKIQKSHKSFANFIAEWPDNNQAFLFWELKKQGSRLGGFTGPRFLRMMGKDVFMLTPDVINGLLEIGLNITPQPTSKKELKIIQDCFNHLHDATGMAYMHLSKILALSSLRVDIL